MRRILLILLAVATLLGVALSARLYADDASATGHIAGNVKDKTGAVLPHAMVVMRGVNGKVVASATTDSQGNYQLAPVPAGPYSLVVEHAGFKKQSEKNINLRANEGQTVDFVLEIAPIQDMIVVTATRTEIPTSQLGSAVTVIDRKQIEERQAVTVSELLRDVPGLSVVQAGGRGSITSLFVRGGESKYNKVLIDGIVVNEPGGFFDFGNLSTANIERIEIVRGPQSALFGSDAIASVIQIFTKRGHSETGRPHISYSVEGGSYRTFRQIAAIDGSRHGMDYAFSFSRLDTQNAAPNNFFNNPTASGNLGFKLSDKSQLRFTFRHEAARAGTPGPTAFGSRDLDAYYKRRDLFTGLVFDHHTTDRWNQKISYTFSLLDRLNEDPIASPPYRPMFRGRTALFDSRDFPFRSLNLSRRHRLNYQSDLSVYRDNLLTFGFEYEEERGNLGANRAKRTNFGYLVQDQLSLAKRLFVVTGVRLEDNGSFGFHASPRVSAAYFLRNPLGEQAWGATKLKFNFGLGIKEPTFFESFSQSPFARGNPNLKPEESRSFDFGVEQRVWNDRAKLEVNYFDNRFRNQIAFATTNPSTFEGSFFNIGKTKANGVELVGMISPGAGFMWTAGYTFLSSEVIRSTSAFSPVFAPGQPLLRRPKNSGFLGGSWTRGRVNLNAHATFIGSRADSDFAGFDPPFTKSERYTKLDVAGTYRITDYVTFFSAVENLLNQTYYEVLGFPALKLNFRAGLRFGF
jgi:outer membrane cobalamin receptor